jgi:hypothetical protein
VLLMLYFAASGIGMLAGGAFKLIGGAAQALGSVVQSQGAPDMWVTFGALLLSLLAAVIGAMAGRRKPKEARA